MEIKNLSNLPDPDLRGWTFSRYISFPSFLTLLQGRAFIPSFGNLRLTEPTELSIPSVSHEDLAMWAFDKPTFREAELWLQRQYERRTGAEFKDHELKDRLFMGEWIEQLSLRRCAWCWFGSQNCHAESMAMWKLYAPSGVMIKTTFRRIQEALSGFTPAEHRYEAGLFNVHYPPRCEHDDKFASEQYISRPFIFKNDSYAHEKEWRIVFQDEGRVMDPGASLDLDVRQLISSVIFSPFFPRHEFDALAASTRSLLSGDIEEFKCSTQTQEDPFDYGKTDFGMLEDCQTEPLPEVMKTL